MNYPKYFDPKNSLNLFCLGKYFNLLSRMYLTNKLPKVLMLTGNQGCGKSPLVNHFLSSIFDKTYDKKNFTILKTSNLLNQFQTDMFQNIIYLEGSNLDFVKLENIRNLK